MKQHFHSVKRIPEIFGDAALGIKAESRKFRRRRFCDTKTVTRNGSPTVFSEWLRGSPTVTTKSRLQTVRGVAHGLARQYPGVAYGLSEGSPTVFLGGLRGPRLSPDVRKPGTNVPRMRSRIPDPGSRIEDRGSRIVSSPFYIENIDFTPKKGRFRKNRLDAPDASG